MKINNITQGWKAYIKNENSDLAKTRSEECKTCPSAVFGSYEKFMPDKTLKQIQGLKCGECKCPLSAKLRSLNETCPKGKW